MMTYNGKYRWVIPLVPTACAYAKLNGYFWKMGQDLIVVLHVQGDFGYHLDVGQVAKCKSRKLQGKVENVNR